MINLKDIPSGTEDDGFGSSPSQVDTYELCPRKWGWRWLENLNIQTRFTSRGIDSHDHLENWFVKRQLPPDISVSGRLATAIIAHVPAPQTIKRDNAELAVTMEIGGIRFYMKIDLFMPDLKPPVIYDHKTTTQIFDKKESNGLKPWILTPETMASDVQASLYAAYGLVQTNAPSIRVQWTYAQKQGAPKTDENGVLLGQSNWQPKTHVVTAELRGRDIQPRLEKSIETSREMKLVKESKARALDLPFNAAACGAYGGCPYVGMCNLTPQQQMESLMSITGSKEDLKARLLARKGANGAAAAPAPAINPPAVAVAAPAPAAAAPAVAAGGSLKERLDARKATQAAPAPAEPVAAAPAAAPAAVAATPQPAESPRPRGRPKKDDTRIQVATQVYVALIQKLEGLGDVEDFTDVLIELAVKHADALIEKCK